MIDEINIKKNKLLDLLVDETIEKSEYKRRTNELDEEIKNLETRVIKLKSEELYEKQLRDKYKEIDNVIEKELGSEESFAKLMQLLIERIVVSKIDGDRQKVRLDVYANVIGKKLTVYNKEIIDDEGSPLYSHDENNDFYYSNRVWKIR